MNELSRFQNIEKIRLNKDPMGNMEIPWEDGLKSMDVFKIPLDLLVYNKYNGRILSRTKSFEKQRHLINPETDDGRDLIAKLLWESKVDRNKKTLDSILTTGGQQKPGIVTRDGIIIDGNRRAMLLRKSGKYDYFKAVILPITLAENPLEIEKLETTFQMGEDEKLGYNPIEKYLKATGLYKKISGKAFLSSDDAPDQDAIAKISDWMGEKKTLVMEYLEVMETMEGYLEYLDYHNLYTQLDGRVDHFVKLTYSMKNFYGEGSGKAFEGYRDDDVDDLKGVSYDFIRVKYDTDRFRYLSYGLRPNHFFGNKEIWCSFRDRHEEMIDLIMEDNIDLDSPNLEKHLNDRDKKFLKATCNDNGISGFDENVDSHYQWLKGKQASEEPKKLIKNAKRALESINQNHKSFKDREVGKELELISTNVFAMIGKSSPTSTLNQVITLLNSIDLTVQDQEKEAVIEKAKEAQRIIYQLSKNLKKIS